MLSSSSILTDEKITFELIKEIVVPRSITSRKGDNGIVLVVGGNRIYHGAPALSSMACLRAGADLVFTAVPFSNVMTIRSFSPNLIVLPMVDDTLTLKSVNDLLKTLPKVPDSVVVGMGMSLQKEALLNLIRQLLSAEKRIKILLDASALIPDVLVEISGTDTIITPHLGEYKRIFGDDITSLPLEQKIANISKNAKYYGITIIVKGYDNVICEGSSGQVATIRRRNPAMTVGGIGDVLSGVTAALHAKMDSPFNASVLGVYFVGQSSDIAYKNTGLHMVATDVIDKLPEAMKPFDKVHG